MVGQTLSHYKILEKLGEGGMGVVYRALDTKLNRDVALKFLPPNFAPTEEEVNRFHQEARAISALNHPNIATIHDVDEVGGQQYLVLEYIPGGTLKSKLKLLKSEDKEFSLSEVLDYGIQIAEGLSHAHRHQIIHRDVKAENMMLTEEGKIKLTDFGLAKLRGSAHITKTGCTLGTVAYMSPEQIRGEEVDHRSDIFSLGVVLYELLTSHLPFRGDFEAALTYSILNETPPGVKSLRQNVPPDLIKIIDRCLEKDKAERFQTAEEIASALRLIQQETSGTGKTVPRRSKVSWMAYGVILTIAAVCIYIFYPKTATRSAMSKTIAVLPFLNLSGIQDNEYFSDGITEDILTQLSKIADFYVISRTTMMQYKGTKKILREIGKELNAGIILEGSVRQSGDRIRIASQLIDAETDRHIWSETYDRDFNDIFGIQTDVAEKIAAALKAKLSPEEKERIEKKPTDNTAAYSYYLKGREYYYRYKNQDNETAIDLFKKAVALDPAYALAWAGLGDAYAMRVAEFGLPITWLDSAVALSTKAVNLDGNSAEAYKALGLAYDCKGFYSKGLECYKKAVKLNPNFLPAIGNMGAIYMSMGDIDKAYPWFKKAIRISPTWVVHYSSMSVLYRILGEYAKAEEWVKKSLELQPDYISGNSALMYIYLLQGKDRQAKDVMKKLVDSYPDDPRIMDMAGFVAGSMGDYAEAKKYFERSMANNPSYETDPTAICGIGIANILQKEGKRAEAEKILAKALKLQMGEITSEVSGGATEYSIATIHAIQGNKKEACDWFQKSIKAGWREYQLALRDPGFENIRNEEQFRKTIAQVKSIVDEMNARVDEMEKNDPE